MIRLRDVPEMFRPWLVHARVRGVLGFFEVSGFGFGLREQGEGFRAFGV